MRDFIIFLLKPIVACKSVIRKCIDVAREETY